METIFNNEDNAEAMSYFCKRMTYEDAYRRAHGETEKAREAMAYRILGAISDIQAYLNKLGFAPR
jgi:hypothetical protein